MVNYVCVEMLVGPPPGRAERPLTEYVPICSFPYVPRGWMLNQINETAPETDSFAKGVSLTGFEDVQLNDCSITISEAFVGYGSSSMSYNMQCVVLCFAAFLPTILCLWFLKLGNDKKKKKKNKYFFLPNNPNQSEKMLLLGSVLGVFHTCRSIDPSGYADRLRIEDFYTCCTAICQAAPLHIGTLMVTSWITIVDGGKSKKPPKWAAILMNVSMIITYIVEISGGLLEYRIGYAYGENRDSGSSDSRVNSFKYSVALVIYIVYASLCVQYGRKIR